MFIICSILLLNGCDGNKIKYDQNDYIGVYESSISQDTNLNNGGSITINKDYSFNEVNEGVTIKGDWEPILSLPHKILDSTTNFIRLNYKDGVTKEYMLETDPYPRQGCKSYYINRVISEFEFDTYGYETYVPVLETVSWKKMIVVKELNCNFIDEVFSTEIYTSEGYIGSGDLKITYDRIKNSGKYSLQFDFVSEVKNSSSYNYYFKPLEKGTTGIIRDDSLYRNESFVNFPLKQFGGRIHIDTICCKHTVNYTTFKSYDFFNNIKFN
jgi:hypothetical protein